MNNPENPPADPQQGFWAPPDQPWLEIRTTIQSRQPYADHFHSTFSVGLILEGGTRLTSGGLDHLARVGDLVLIEPGAIHKCNPVDGRARSYHMIYLDPAWCLARAGFPPGLRLRAGQVLVREPGLFQGLAETAAAIARRGRADEERLADLIARLTRDYCRAEEPAPERAAEARRLIGADLENPVRLAEVARGVGLGREGFIRAFRRSTGLTPGNYRQCLRLSAARRLLRQGHDIAEVALATGYADQSHFHRMFVKYFSATPGQYRANRSLFHNK